MAANARQAFQEMNIFAALSDLSIGGEAPRLDGEFRGGQCHIFKVTFQDTTSLAVRVPLYMESAGSPDGKIEVLQTELRNLQVLDATGFPWSPRCCGHSLNFDNAIEHPFLVLRWVHGATLSWSDDFPPRPVREKLLRQMAAIQQTLIEYTIEEGSSAMTFFPATREE